MNCREASARSGPRHAATRHRRDAFPVEAGPTYFLSARTGGFGSLEKFRKTMSGEEVL